MDKALIVSRFNDFCDFAILHGFAKNDSELSLILGLSKPVVGYMRKGKRGLSNKTRTLLETEFGVHPMWFSGYESPMFVTEKQLALFPEEMDFTIAAIPPIDTADLQRQTNYNVGRFPDAVAAGDNTSMSGYEKLPQYKVPGVRGSSVSFKIEGHSMEPILESGQTVFAKPLEGLEELQEGSIYIVITQYRQVAKRVFRDNKHALLLVSENKSPEYGSYTVANKEVIQIFKVEQKLSSEGL